MSKLIYNGLTISHVQTNSFSRQPIYSEGGDYLYTHFQLDVSGIINPKAGAYGLDENGQIAPMPGATAASTDVLIRHYLLQPRRQLVFMMVTNEVLLVAPAKRPGNNSGYYPMDANNGPMPRVHSITRIDGDQTFHVNFSVECWLNECPVGGNNPSRALLSNRFSQAHDVDDQMMTVITTTGQAFFRSDVLEQAGEVADTYRRQCLPPCPLGFKRTRMQIAVTTSRNVLTYNVVDQQRFFDIGDTNPLLGGSGIADIDAQFSTATISNEGGVAGGRSVAEMAVRVRGVKEASTWILTQTAFKVAGAKLPLNKMPQSGILSHLSLTQNMTGRDVTLRISLTLPPSNTSKLGILNSDILRINDLFTDEVFGKNPGPYNDGGSRGSYNREILTSKLKDACSSVGKPSEGGYGRQGPGTDYSDNIPLDPIIVYTDVVPDFSPKVSYGQIKSFHTDYRLDYKYRRKSHRKQIPVAKNPYASQANSGSNSGTGFGSSPNQPQSQATAPSNNPDNQPTLTPDCEIVHLAYPTTEVVVTWTAERVGEPPKYPNPFNTEQNFVLIDDKIQPASPEQLPDGTNYVYRVSGEFTYALQSARGTGDNLPIGALPLWDRTYEESYLPSDYASVGILGPSGNS